MKKFSNRWLVCLVLLTSLAVPRRGWTQDIHFSQFYEAPLLRNPSLAGLFTGDVRVQAVYRDQWNSVTNAYRTGSLNAEYKMPIGKGDDFITTGLQLLYDKAGTVGWTSTHILPAVNFHKSLSDYTNSYLSLGVMGGYVQRSLDRSKMTTNSTYNGQGDGETFLSPQYGYFDGSVGLSYNRQISDDPNDNFFIAAGYHHFVKPGNSFYRNPNVTLDPKWIGSVGMKFGVTEASYITIMADHSRQGMFRETVGGALWGTKIGDDLENPDYVIHGGVFMRLNDAIIPTIKLDYRPFTASLSYDVNFSKLKTSSYGRGGFELSLSYVGFTRSQSSSADAVLCPRF